MSLLDNRSIYVKGVAKLIVFLKIGFVLMTLFLYKFELKLLVDFHSSNKKVFQMF